MDPYRRYSLHPMQVMLPPPPRTLYELGYTRKEHAKLVKEIDRLFTGYGTQVVFGARHSAPCGAWRAERVQLNTELLPRFANRVHVFQKGQEESGKRYGRYLGYVSLRPKVEIEHAGFQYTIVANIAPPRFMLRPRYHLITCVGGAPDGVMAFRCVPFCVPNEDAKNHASCLHAAVHAAVLLKVTTFGFTPISSQDMIALLWSISDGRRTMLDLAKSGASLYDALQVLQHEEVRAGGILETVPLKHFLAEDYKNAKLAVAKDPREAKLLAMSETHRCITDYLANGLPLIVELDLDLHYAHSIMVFGMHLLHDPEDPQYVEQKSAGIETRVDVDELPGRFVAHDIRIGPFAELSAAELLERAWVIHADNNLISGISFLAIAPRGARMGIYDVRRLAKYLMLQESPSFWQTYFDYYGVSGGMLPLKCDDMRYVTRLLRTGQVIQRYIAVTRGDRVIPHDKAFKMLQKLNLLNAPSDDNEQYWWCVEVRIPQREFERDISANEISPALVYIWQIEDYRDSAPKMIIRHLHARRYALIVEDEEVHYEFTSYRA